MADKKTSSGHETPKSSGDAGPKKPYATIDLRATEVKDDKSGVGQSGKAASDADKTGSGKTGSDKTGSGKTGSGKTGLGKTGAGTGSDATSKSSSVPPAGSKATAAASAAAGEGAKGTAAEKVTPVTGSKASAEGLKEERAATASSTGSSAGQSGSQSAKNGGKPPPPPPPRKSSGGSFIGRFFSMLLAGLVGGFLALLGADTLKPQLAKYAPKLGIPSEALQSNQRVDQLASRLADLEQSTAAADSGGDDVSELKAQLESAMAKIAQLEALPGKVEEISKTQASLSETAKTLSETVGSDSTDGAGGASGERLAKLEQQFATLSSAAGDNPDASSLPQLAAITGRIADLEASVDAQMKALREAVGNELDTRVSTIAESSEQAKSAAQRMDRQLATVTTDAARLGQRMQALKADGDRIAETLRVVQEETGQLRSALDALKADLNSRLGKVAKPADIQQAIEPVTQKLSALESSVSNVVNAEADRKTNAQRIVLSLELANLKRAIESGDSFKDELGDVQKSAEGVLDVSALQQYENSGVATLSELERSFRPVIAEVLEAAERPDEGSVFDQLLAGAKSVVKVRRTDYPADDTSAAAVVTRMEKALKDGKLGTVLEQAKDLKGDAAAAASAWLKQVKSRHAVDVALAKIEGQLKTSLSGGGQG